MLNILSRITGAHRTEVKDAKRVYQKSMEQSRQPVFYGQGLCDDSTDGRMEILCLHLSTIMYALRGHGETGAKLTQAIYDVMIEDFDVALREEGLADTGVKRRIKPLAKRFFTRAKHYAEAFDANDVESDVDDALAQIVNKYVCKTGDSGPKFVDYIKNFHANLSKTSLGNIAGAQVDFPKFR